MNEWQTYNLSSGSSDNGFNCLATDSRAIEARTSLWMLSRATDSRATDSRSRWTLQARRWCSRKFSIPSSDVSLSPSLKNQNIQTNETNKHLTYIFIAPTSIYLKFILISNVLITDNLFWATRNFFIFYFLFHFQPKQIIADSKHSNSLDIKEGNFSVNVWAVMIKKTSDGDDYKTNNFQSSLCTMSLMIYSISPWSLLYYYYFFENDHRENEDLKIQFNQEISLLRYFYYCKN